jgi:putative phage-type endonuclease
VATLPREPFTIGGSEAASACGLDPFRSRVMLWAEKTGRAERETSEAMRWGTLLEPVIVDELREQGEEIIYPLPPEPVIRDFLTGHPDGYVVGGPMPLLLEVKTAGPWARHEWVDGQAPAAYIVQVQHYLHLTALDEALVAVLLAGQHLETRIVERDDALIAAMLDAEREFWGYLHTDTPPPPDGSDSATQAIRALHPEAVPGKVYRLTGDEWQAFRDLRLWEEAKAKAEDRCAELRQRVQLAMGDAEVAISPGDAEVAKWANVSRRAVDVARLKQAAPHVAETYTKETTTRRFTLA